LVGERVVDAGAANALLCLSRVVELDVDGARDALESWGVEEGAAAQRIPICSVTSTEAGFADRTRAQTLGAMTLVLDGRRSAAAPVRLRCPHDAWAEGHRARGLEWHGCGGGAGSVGCRRTSDVWCPDG